MTDALAARVADWHPRRLEAVNAALPGGVTPPGTSGRILHAALRLFSEYGFQGASVRQIAAEVGINPASLYAHYPSKEHILAEIVLVGHQELDRRLRAALAAAPPSPTARLAALVREHALIHCDYPLLAVVANTELHGLTAEAAAPALHLRAGCRSMLADVLVAGSATGEFDLIDPDLTAIAIGGLGLQVAHWFAPGGPFTPDQVARAYAQLALRMVGAAEVTATDTEKG
jgi:AcrR family transcriptional regulator